MAVLTLSEAMSRIEGYLDKVSEVADAYMRECIREKADRGYATGALASSVNTEIVSESARSVGSSLEYAKFVNEGRGAVEAKNAPYLQYYDTKKKHWVRTKSVGPMSGIDFTGATKEYIERTYIPL